MKPDIKVDITVGTLQAMTMAQLVSLQDNVIREGNWETAAGLRVVGQGDYIGVEPMELVASPTGSSTNLKPLMFIGIETDGYTHS